MPRGAKRRLKPRILPRMPESAPKSVLAFSLISGGKAVGLTPLPDSTLETSGIATLAGCF